MNVLDMSSQSSFAIAEKAALITVILDSFGMNFVHMNVQFGAGDGFERATFTEMLARVFMHTFYVELKSLLTGEASPA